jgi:RNA polymerase sigma-70 factor (ECF subfamily)
MSGDPFPLNLPLPLPLIATDSCEATDLYRELHKPLLRYLVGLGLSREEAQDVAQDAFLRLHKHLAGNGSQENIRGWLFRVAHNRARNYQQSYAQRLGEPLNADVDPISNAATPEQLVLEKERSRRLERAIQGLTQPERECLMLRAEGLRYREIGEVLGVPTSTVGDTVDRAIKKLTEKCNV